MRGVEANLAGPNLAGETPPEPEPKRDELAPGEFVSDELRSDCVRFLEEVKSVVRRRWEAGLSREPG